MTDQTPKSQISPQDNVSSPKQERSLDQTQTAYQQAETIIGHYNELPPDFSAIDQLIRASNRLAWCAYWIGKDCGDSKRKFELATYKRRVVHAQHKKANMDGGMSAAAAEVEATLETADHLRDEKDLEGAYNYSRIILSQVNTILDRMNQMLSYLKQEKGYLSHLEGLNS
jgi:hypothetical protein